MKKQIAVSDSSDARPFIEKLGIEVDFISPIPKTEEECVRAFKGYPVVIALGEPFSAPVLKALAPELALLARFGLGYDKVDLDAARDAGICVTNAAGTMASGVAETAFILMLEAARRLCKYDAEMHGHIWNKAFCGTQLEHKTVGIIGFGAIGQKLAQYCGGFGCRLLVYDVAPDEDALRRCGARQVTLEELAAQADYVSVNCPLLPQTRHLVDEAFIGRMKPTAVLVNTSRGPTVDEEALLAALEKGRIAGAGLDVFAQEPLPENSGLPGLPNVVMLPHIGSFTQESMMDCALDVERSILAMREGRRPEHCLNPGYEQNRAQ